MIIKERNRLIYERYINGETMVHLAEMYGLTKQRIGQICYREYAKAKIAETNNELEKLLLKYVNSYMQEYCVSKTLEINKIKTIRDLVNASETSIRANMYCVYTGNEIINYDDVIFGVIMKMKKYANRLVKKGLI